MATRKNSSKRTSVSPALRKGVPAGKRHAPKRVGTLDGMTEAQIDALPQDEYAQRVFRGIELAPATLSEPDLKRIEARFTDGPNGVARRMALLPLTKPGAWLIDTVRSDRKVAVAFADVKACGEEYANWLREVANMVERSCVRIGVVLCVREDMAAVIEEARRG